MSKIAILGIPMAILDSNVEVCTSCLADELHRLCHDPCGELPDGFCTPQVAMCLVDVACTKGSLSSPLKTSHEPIAQCLKVKSDKERSQR